MVELHKINIGRDAHVKNMMHAGIDGMGVCGWDMRADRNRSIMLCKGKVSWAAIETRRALELGESSELRVRY